MKRAILALVLVLVAITQTYHAGYADAVASPCVFARQTRVTAGAASAATTLDITVASATPTVRRAQSITVRNENTTTGDDAYINVESGTAVATDASPPGANIRINANESISLDVRASQISYIRAGANSVTLKIVTIY